VIQIEGVYFGSEELGMCGNCGVPIVGHDYDDDYFVEHGRLEVPKACDSGPKEIPLDADPGVCECGEKRHTRPCVFMYARGEPIWSTSAVESYCPCEESKDEKGPLYKKRRFIKLQGCSFATRPKTTPSA
jgi:hypothetical protein